MEKVGYIILLGIVIFWLGAIIYGLISIFPFGLIGLLLILAFGLLFAKVLKDKIKARKEEKKYEKIKW